MLLAISHEQKLARTQNTTTSSTIEKIKLSKSIIEPSWSRKWNSFKINFKNFNKKTHYYENNQKQAL
jgi:hypothetical protein